MTAATFWILITGVAAWDDTFSADFSGFGKMLPYWVLESGDPLYAEWNGRLNVADDGVALEVSFNGASVPILGPPLGVFPPDFPEPGTFAGLHVVEKDDTITFGLSLLGKDNDAESMALCLKDSTANVVAALASTANPDGLHDHRERTLEPALEHPILLHFKGSDGLKLEQITWPINYTFNQLDDASWKDFPMMHDGSPYMHPVHTAQAMIAEKDGKIKWADLKFTGPEPKFEFYLDVEVGKWTSKIGDWDWDYYGSGDHSITKEPDFCSGKSWITAETLIAENGENPFTTLDVPDRRETVHGQKCAWKEYCLTGNFDGSPVGCTADWCLAHLSGKEYCLVEGSNGKMHEQECSSRRLTESPESRRLDEKPTTDKKNLAVNVLRNWQKSRELIDAMKKEKARLERRALVAYIVGAIFVLLVAGKATQYVHDRRKHWAAVSPGDDEALMQESRATTAETPE